MAIWYKLLGKNWKW